MLRNAEKLCYEIVEAVRKAGVIAPTSQAVRKAGVLAPTLVRVGLRTGPIYLFTAGAAGRQTCGGP